MQQLGDNCCPCRALLPVLLFPLRMCLCLLLVVGAGVAAEAADEGAAAAAAAAAAVVGELLYREDLWWLLPTMVEMPPLPFD